MRLQLGLSCLLVLIGLATCQELGTEGTAHPDFIVPGNETIENGNSTDDGLSSEPATPTSTTSPITEISAAAETTLPSLIEATGLGGKGTAGTRPTNTGRPRPSTSPKPPKEDEHGTLIDKRGCVHATLEHKHRLFTATCRAKCGKIVAYIENGTPCLQSSTTGRGHKKRGKKCLKGKCFHGHCRVRPSKKVTCRVPKGTVHYYDDDDYYNYYNDDNYGYYDYYNSFQAHGGKPNFAE